MSWREAIAERCKTMANVGDDESKRIRRRRTELEEEQKRLINAYTKGYVTEQDMDEKMEQIRTELFALPVMMEKDSEKATEETLSAGETLMRMADYWNEATEEERRDMVWSLLNAEGLFYDLERHIIVGLKPRSSVLPVLALGLEATSMWEQREEGLWLREDYFPPKIDRKHPHLPSHPPALTPAQQEQVIMLIRQGMSLRKIAELLETSYESVRRFLKYKGIVTQPSVQKLTPEQLEEAYALLKADVSFRDVAEIFGISDASLARLAKRDGVVLRSRREKLTPTQRKLTTEQQQEAYELVESGISLRQTAKLLGISRSALKRILRDGANQVGESEG